MHWRRKWQPTPVFLPGESQGRGSLVDCCLRGCIEADMTEVTQQQQQQSLVLTFVFSLVVFRVNSVVVVGLILSSCGVKAPLQLCCEVRLY